MEYRVSTNIWCLLLPQVWVVIGQRYRWWLLTLAKRGRVVGNHGTVKGSEEGHTCQLKRLKQLSEGILRFVEFKLKFDMSIDLTCNILRIWFENISWMTSLLDYLFERSILLLSNQFSILLISTFFEFIHLCFEYSFILLVLILWFFYSIEFTFIELIILSLFLYYYYTPLPPVWYLTCSSNVKPTVFQDWKLLFCWFCSKKDWIHSFLKQKYGMERNVFNQYQTILVKKLLFWSITKKIFETAKSFVLSLINPGAMEKVLFSFWYHFSKIQKFCFVPERLGANKNVPNW